MNIAILTTEYIADYPDGGGLANFLGRLSRLLVKNGHRVVVFVTSENKTGADGNECIKVTRISRDSRPFWMRVIGIVVRIVDPTGGLFNAYVAFSNAWLAAAELEREHRMLPFDLVHSADYRGIGLFVKCRPSRLHIIRCSHAIDLYQQIDGQKGRSAQLLRWLEFKALRRADGVYAPSHLLAEHYSKTLRIDVQVIRPPILSEPSMAAQLPAGLPARYMIHFGQLCIRKGTYWLLRSLKDAFDQEPNIRVVIIGKGDFRKIGDWLAELGRHRGKVVVLYPFTKSELYAVLKHADTAILPSLVDNLPNTVIESLSLGVPVIGTRGASIDELVEDGKNGILVESGNVDELAAAIVGSWRRGSKGKAGFLQTDILRLMEPETAIHELTTYVNTLRKNRE